MLGMNAPKEEQNEKSDINNFLRQIDEEALKAAAEFAYKESKAGHCIPNSQVFESIMEEMGWNFIIVSYDISLFGAL